MAEIINGKQIAAAVKDEVRAYIKKEQRDIGLAVILVGNDPASKVYVGAKEKACIDLGIRSRIIRLPEETTTEALLQEIEQLNQDASIQGILVQLPLPKEIKEQKVLEAIVPEKDVDGFHPVNVGRLSIGEPCMRPCTAWGVVLMLRQVLGDLTGLHCVVVGRSNIVGKPVAQLLTAADATVTLCHSRTKDLKQLTRRADVVICAVGRPKFFDASYFSEQSVVIDVGIHRLEDGLCGDVDFKKVAPLVRAISPVPGGVGPMTIAVLMENCAKGAR
ncbi:MAG: bifunctional 5,10-methylenetetrahydrofolate dehydrogenase/5,10-methenyltetrahydrofolate cyclohydrolase [Lachnospiraceae bacterium]|nr:bifunctional 5,10-methylenetetrahydrofolate dehydrogenase/5,10-methenyltetrahydrofolate cyclohydrolase [Lachnospiraceae bacterium]MDY5741528.1 bifunctional 5,10-methylenetetrahydrofolate dehydrogenase/5,10-methenyltetrahydrofolate cyclohydrolase [Lachnospiraceae bacterium]